MIANMLSNKKLNPTVTELFIRGRKLNIFIVFITQSYISVFYALLYCDNSKQTRTSMNYIYLIIYKTLTLKTLWIFTKNVLKSHILF